MSYTSAGADGQSRPSYIMRRVAGLFGAEIKAADLNFARSFAPLPALELAVSGEGGAAGEVCRYFEGTVYSEKLREVLKCSGIEGESLTQGSVTELYGERPKLSPSQIEILSSCRFAYFMRYGLRARPRERGDFDAPEMGIFMHYVLEGVARQVSDEGGFHRVAPERSGEIARELTERFANEKLHGLEGRGSRFKYLFRRLSDSACRIALDVAEEMSRSDFEPLGIEQALADGAHSIAGQADRVDGYVRGDRLYLRVVDYKTGKKTFSLTDIWHGIGLQMLIYLFSLQRDGRRLYGREAMPAGVLYAPARDIIIRAKTNLSDEDIAAEREKELKRSGLILDDPEIIEAMEHGEEKRYLPVKLRGGEPVAGAASAERLGALGRHVDKILRELDGELCRGNVSADPYFRSAERNACLWCEYGSACHFDESVTPYRYLPTLGDGEFWDKIEASDKSIGKMSTL